MQVPKPCGQRMAMIDLWWHDCEGVDAREIEGRAGLAAMCGNGTRDGAIWATGCDLSESREWGICFCCTIAVINVADLSRDTERGRVEGQKIELRAADEMGGLNQQRRPWAGNARGKAIF